MVSTLRFIQINLHKASAAVAELSRRIVAEQIEISVIIHTAGQSGGLIPEGDSYIIVPLSTGQGHTSSSGV